MRWDMAPPEIQFNRLRTQTSGAKAQPPNGLCGTAKAVPSRDSQIKTLATGADELDVAGICPDFEDGSAAIQLAFGCHRSRSPLSAFTGNVNVGEIADNFVAVG